MPSNQLPPDRLKVSLDTRRPIQLETSAEILASLGASLRSFDQIGRRARIEIVEVQQGSWWAHLLIIGGGVGAIAVSAQALVDEIKAGKTPFSRAIAAAASEGDAEVCTITTADDDLEIPRRAMRALIGMIPNENFYGVGPDGQTAIEPGPIGDDSASPIISSDDGISTEMSTIYDKKYIGDLESDVQKILRRLNDRSYHPPLPKDVRQIDAADRALRGESELRTGTFHYAESGALIFATKGTFGEARLRSGLAQPLVGHEYNVNSQILGDPNDGRIFFAVDWYNQT